MTASELTVVCRRPTTADPVLGPTEVALNPAEAAAAQLDPVVFPTPDLTLSPAGPDWIQIGTEGGFLPQPIIVPNQHITWITDPTRFDVGNVDLHAVLLGPAERADVIRTSHNLPVKPLSSTTMPRLHSPRVLQLMTTTRVCRICTPTQRRTVY